jgi:large subunit ribosomal protein L23
MAELHEILLAPVVTEKTSRLMATQNTYVFKVGESANKIQIRDAVAAVFGVSVEDVRTANVRGKFKRFGRHYGKRPNWKKAYVRLADGDSLNFYES